MILDLFCEQEKLLLNSYGVSPLVVDSKVTSAPIVDETSKNILEMYAPIVLSNYIPSAVVGDGNNCFYIAVSFGM